MAFRANNNPAMGKRLRKIRKASGLSRSAFARLLGQIRQRWYYYERGRMPDRDTLLWLHTNLGISLTWLIAGTGPKAVPGRDVLKLEKKR